MIEVVSVRFNKRGKIYFFDPAGIEVNAGQAVIVETSKGLELGDCVVENHQVCDERIVPPLRPIIRIASEEDLKMAEINKSKEAEAFEICKNKIIEHGLDMKLVGAECNFEGSKMLFFFTSDGRVDFRELVKDLASIFRTRIELRQIGVRDEAKMQGGLGICGRPFCCTQFLDEFMPVSTKMAKVQSMSLNPTKISGSCGRLMCCLRYEHEAYEELVKNMPKNGAFVETISGYGNVVQTNLLRQKVKVRLDGEGDETIKTFDTDEVATVPGGRPKPGETPPSVLIPPPKKKKQEEEDFFSAIPVFHSLEDTTQEKSGAKSEELKPAKSHRRRSRGKKKKPSEKPASAGKPGQKGPSAGKPGQKGPSAGKPGQKGPSATKAGPKEEQSKPKAAKGAQGAIENSGNAEAPKKSGRPKRRRYHKPKPKQTEGQKKGE